MIEKLFFFLAISFFLFGCQHTEPIRDHSSVLKSNFFEKEELKGVEEVTITIGAIGDVLLHERVYQRAKKPDGTYDFDPMLNEVKPLLKKPDFLMANQESMPGGVEIGLSTYPSFNSPKEIVTTLQKLGVDMVIGANNHTLDRGMNAIESALDYYEEIGMDYVGVYRNKEDREIERIVIINDIAIGVLAYTYGTNGIPIPHDHPDVVAMINQERMVRDVQNLRGKADVIVVHMHWGNEYEREPNDEQRNLARVLSEAGADIIFGHHPHVLQPIEKIDREEGLETIVFYSLGNFFSGQKFQFTDIGGVATVDVTKVADGDEVTVSFSSPKIEPTVVIQKESGFYVIPMFDVERSTLSGTTYDQVVDHTLQYLHRSEKLLTD
ncbi:CapA family protein [Alkalihalobacterium elongatum]|uniref:CapA family protein n=1 Tax=Alkalihalobacterium elongatum TaxID=2675466 RepID=UPI001C1F8D0D|nr:CapA family protein [Alkalihalobacterium elongatum]